MNLENISCGGKAIWKSEINPYISNASFSFFFVVSMILKTICVIKTFIQHFYNKIISVHLHQYLKENKKDFFSLKGIVSVNCN